VVAVAVEGVLVAEACLGCGAAVERARYLEHLRPMTYESYL